MDVSVQYFEDFLSEGIIEKSQEVNDVESFTKSSLKIFRSIYSNLKFVDLDTFKSFIPKRMDSNRRLIYELSYNKLMEYNQKHLLRLFFLKFEEKKKVPVLNRLLIHTIYQYRHLLIKSEKKIKPIKFKDNGECNEEQLSFIQRPLETGKVYGPPGTGKTKTIISKIFYLIENQTIEPDGFIALTFSKNSVQDFIDKLNHDYLAKRVRTFHSLSGYILSILSQGTKTTSQSIDTCVYKCMQLLKNNNINKFDYFKNTKVIFVDEAQDINEVQYNFVKYLAENLSASLILIGDANQCIYKFQNASDDFLLNHEGFKIELVKNYRSTKEIVDIINKCAPKKNDAEIESVKGSFKSKPTIMIGNMDEILNDIVSILSNSFNDTVAIIGPVRKSRMLGDQYGNIGLNTIVNCFDLRNIKYNLCYDDNEKVELSQRKKLSIQPGIVNLLTIHGSKGLEFDRVFLINYHLTTFTIKPTKQEYENLKYLWYVGLSRAKTGLKIYALEDKLIWPPHQSYNDLITSNRDITYQKIKLKKEDKKIYFWTDIISDRVLFTETQICKFEEMIAFEPVLIAEIKKQSKQNHKKYHDFMNTYLLFYENKILREAVLQFYEQNDEDELIEFDELSSLYGIWAEETLMYAYQSSPRLEQIKIMLETMIVIEEKYISEACKMIRFFKKALIGWKEFTDYKKVCINSNFIQYVEKREKKQDQFFCFIQNINQYFNHEELKNKVEYYEKKQNLEIEDIFDICLFHYQYENEKKSILNKNFKVHLEKLKPFDIEIRKYAKTLPKGYQFQFKLKMALLPVYGIADAIYQNKIIEFKFSKTKKPTMTHMMQLIGYCEMFRPDAPHTVELEVVNLYHLCTHKINRKKYDRYQFYRTISLILNETLRNCCWIYDLETTNLISENCEVNIMEIHIQELTTGIVPISSLIKVGNVQYDERTIETLNGITRTMCNNYGIQPQQMVDKIKEIIKISNGFFIAHNGNQFDHKIIRRYIEMEFKTLDTLQLIPLFYDQPLKSKKLSNLYETIIGHSFTGHAHRAQADVQMMIEIMKRLELTSEIIHNLN